MASLDPLVARAAPLASRPPPARSGGVLGRIRRRWFPTWANGLVTALCLVALALLLKPVLGWALIEATWRGDAAQCRAHLDGACWAFIAAKLPFMVFGFYPADEHWRPAAASLLCLGTIVVSALPAFWRRELALAWLAMVAAVFALMHGGVFGLSVQPTAQWGGLPLTLMLATVGLVGAFPIGVLLALGRRSRLPVIRMASIGYIELVRGVPLVTVLVIASILFPLLMPEGLVIDKLLRAQVALILFAAAYIAEIVRGGLQAIPRGQYEAAEALGLGYGLTMTRIILPQALKIVIPSLVNTAIGFFKDTTLVIIIGLFDFLTAIKAALTDAAWLGFPVEAYVFAALVYFGFCFSISRYSLWLERHVAHARPR